MNLESWLQQDHWLAEQLAVVEGLCTAVNEAHQRGVLHRALEPANIEVFPDGRCDLQLAVRPDAATPAAARYRAPEILEGASYSPLADVYAVGVLCYEVLSGHNPSATDRPRQLTELRAEVSRELSDAIMGCLERGTDWRPKDVRYLLEVVSSLRNPSAEAPAPAEEPTATATADTPHPVEAPAPTPTADSPRPVVAPTAPPRQPAAKGSRSLVGLLLGFLVLLGGVAWLWLQSQRPAGPAAAQLGVPTPPPPATAPSLAPPPPSPTAAPAPQPKPTAEARKSSTTEPSTEPPQPRPLQAPAPRPLAEPTPVPPLPEPAPTALAPGPQLEEPAGPAVLTALSPLTLKRSTTAILDLHGQGLRPEHRAQVVRVKATPGGITIVRQKYVSPTLIQVVVKLDETVAPGPYGVGVADAQGNFSNSLSITVTK